MDPNDTLNHLREVVKWWNEGDADASDLERAVESFEALDEWISRGGFLPDAWRPVTGIESIKSRGGF